MLLLKERLVSRRHALNLSQAEVAAKAGISERTVASYESGDGKPTLGTLQKLATALDVKVSFLTEEAAESVLREQPAPMRSADNFPFDVLRTDQLSRLINEAVAEAENAEPNRRLQLHRVVQEANNELLRRAREQQPSLVPRSRPGSFAISPEDKAAIEHVEAAVDREIQESRSRPRAGARTGESASPSPASSPASKAKHPSHPK